MFQLLIIEDDEDAAKFIASMVEKHPQASGFSVQIADPSVLEDRLAKEAMPDIAIVDIELGQGCQNGIELVRRFFPQTSGTQVIYATGYIEYCTAVYQTKHVSFLVKPLKQDEFDFALGRALQNIEKAKREVLPVQADGIVKMVPSAGIEYIESKLRKVHIHVEGHVLQMYATLSDIEAQLPSYFARCHKSFLVNMNHITEMKAGSLTMRSGDVVPVSQGKRKEVKERFAKFLAYPVS